MLEIAKNKDGRLARLRLNFEPEHMSFSYQIPDVNSLRNQDKLIKGKKPTKAADEVPQTKPGELVELEDQDGGDIPF